MGWKRREKMFQELPFYNRFIEKPKIKGLKNIHLLQELSFYDKLNICDISKVFRWYARSYKVEIVNSKDPLARSEASQWSIKDFLKVLFKDVFDEIKGFNYQITVKDLLTKDRQNRDSVFSPVYFNSLTKTVINFKYGPDKSFHEVFLQNWQ